MVLLSALTSAASGSERLQLYVYTSPEDSFGVTSTLVYGKTEAVLIAAQYHTGEAIKLADQIVKTGTKLKAIFITHPDEDHYFGLAVLHEHFPETPIYISAKGLKQFERTVDRKLAGSRKYKPSATPGAVPVPQALPNEEILVDGQTIQFITDWQGDVLRATNRFVWVPSLKAVIAGDIVFNRVHVWLGDSSEKSRSDWLKALQGLEALHPLIVVPGHQQSPDLKEASESLAFTREYISAFEAARRSSTTANNIITLMKKKFPGCDSEYLLLRSATVAMPN